MGKILPSGGNTLLRSQSLLHASIGCATTVWRHFYPRLPRTCTSVAEVARLSAVLLRLPSVALILFGPLFALLGGLVLAVATVCWGGRGACSTSLLAISSSKPWIATVRATPVVLLAISLSSRICIPARLAVIAATLAAFVANACQCWGR